MSDFWQHILAWWEDFQADFYLNFIEDDRWKYLVRGLKNTLIVTVLAVLVGIVLGTIVALIRTSHDKDDGHSKGFFHGLLNVLNAIANVYLTVIRGTPAVVQLMIMYYIIFASSNNKILIAVLSFGINSGAYVAEIIRAGITSVDPGQSEAGRSLGLNYAQTMRYIVIPQALKNVLPALANEFISLLKETAVSGYVALIDLTKAGDIIRGRTYSAFMPLIAVALIYLILVMFFTYLERIMERRLSRADH